MKQSRKHSLIGSITNVAIGYIVGLASQLLIFPLFDIHVPLSTNMIIVGWFTLISIIRSYVLRRYFTSGRVA